MPTPFHRANIMTIQKTLFALLASGALGLLTACGGGGSDTSGGTSDTTTVTTLVPSSSMTWSTVSAPTLGVTVTNADGTPASGAAVRFFTLSRVSPQDGSTLEEPVPVNLLETAVSGSDGVATLAVRLPADQTEVLVVATLGDTKASSAMNVTGTAPSLTLHLAQ
jgi:hypothetical protein